MSEATFKQIIAGQVNSLVLPRILSMLNFRIFHHDRSVDPAGKEYNEHVVFSFWHEYIVVVLPRWGHTPMTVLCSQHRDGEWVNQTAVSLGLNIVRGSSTRGGAPAIRQLKKNSRYSSIAVTPDGPRGPRREMAMGPIFLASRLGIPLVPIGVGIDRPYRLNTWDKFAIPRPTSRVRIITGPKVYVPRKADRTQLEATQSSVQKLMNDLTHHAQRWASSKEKLKGEQPFIRCRRTNRLVFDQAPVTEYPQKRSPVDHPRAA